MVPSNGGTSGGGPVRRGAAVLGAAGGGAGVCCAASSAPPGPAVRRAPKPRRLKTSEFPGTRMWCASGFDCKEAVKKKQEAENQVSDGVMLCSCGQPLPYGRGSARSRERQGGVFYGFLLNA